VPGERGCAGPGARDVVLGCDFQAHLRRPVVLVAQAGDDGVGGRVVPAVEEATGTPGPDPVVPPHRWVSDRVAVLPAVTGEVAQLRDVRRAAGPTEKVAAPLDEPVATHERVQLADPDRDRQVAVA